jgi:hypothetical protein
MWCVRCDEWRDLDEQGLCLLCREGATAAAEADAKRAESRRSQEALEAWLGVDSMAGGA